MGKQIQICTTETDNILLQDYLLKTFNCVFLKSFAPTIEELWIDSFAGLLDNGKMVYVWNKEFNWKPQYSQTVTKEKLYYVNNKSTAPLVEFVSTDWQNNMHGRIYWSKVFNPETLPYDVDSFDKFYHAIVKYVQKNAAGKIKRAGVNVYYLKGAWERHSLMQNGC